MYGYSNLAVVPLRREPSHNSEMISQLLYGEIFEVSAINGYWLKISVAYDNYTGWIDRKQVELISEVNYNLLLNRELIVSTDFVNFLSDKDNVLMPIFLGSVLNHLFIDELNTRGFRFEGSYQSGKKSKSDILKTAMFYLNTPYLWGGKSNIGIDCSGFVQMVYKINGYNLPRDAYQQVELGTALNFLEEAQVGDLAFFDDENGNITHTGIIVQNNMIIHAHGKVRIDYIDHMGIYIEEYNKHTHNLRIIKRII